MTLPVEMTGLIETWRESLARHLALRNPALSDPGLNHAVQAIMNSLIFLRICEGRGIERFGRLLALVDGPGVCSRLMAIFRQAADRYNSRLFHVLPEMEKPGRSHGPTPEFIIDDEPLRKILRSLYDPESPCEFSALPVEVLGQVYEQSLGKLITRIADGHVRIDDKPKARKSGGVFYTPARIADYIIQQTVGALLEGRTVISCRTKPPKLDRPLRTLDPACGSGSFLLGACQQLLDWYRTCYERHNPEILAAAKVPPIYQAGSGGWRLTLAERERIVLDHVFGVDIDPQAVEITRLSLLLKVLEGEEEHVFSQDERGLPNLATNIKCGNSLIGPDFYEDHHSGVLDEGQRLRVHALDWHAEFPEAFDNGGFEAVIGNPPWGQKAIDLGDATEQYLRRKYVSLAGILDIFRPFVEQSVNLLAPDGRYGMVLPDVILLKDYPDTRLFMLRNLRLTDIRWWGRAFDDAVIDAVTIVAEKGCASDGQAVRVRIEDREHPFQHEIPQSDFMANPRYTFNLHLTREKRAILRMLDPLPKLSDFFDVHEGVHSGNMRAELFVDSALDGTCKPLYLGRDEIVPYRLRWNGRYVRLAVAAKSGGGKYANPGRRDWHERPKVLVRRTGDHVMAAVDERGFHASNNFFLVFPRRDCGLDLHGLCVLLNSRFMTWYFRCIEPRRGRVFAELKIKHLAIFPLPKAVATPDGCHELNTLGRQQMVETGHLAPRQSESDQCATQRIDRLVYRLYGLPDAEWNR